MLNRTIDKIKDEVLLTTNEQKLRELLYLNNILNRFPQT